MDVALKTPVAGGPAGTGPRGGRGAKGDILSKAE